MLHIPAHTFQLYIPAGARLLLAPGRPALPRPGKGAWHQAQLRPRPRQLRVHRTVKLQVMANRHRHPGIELSTNLREVSWCPEKDPTA